LFNVEDVLGLAQIRADRFKKIITKFNLQKAIEEVILIQKDNATERRITLGFKVEAQPGEADFQKILVHSDKKRLQ